MERTELFLISLVPIVDTAYEVPPEATNSAKSDGDVREGQVLAHQRPRTVTRTDLVVPVAKGYEPSRGRRARNR